MSRGARAPAAALAAGAALWVSALRGLDLRAMDDTGLVSVLPAAAVGGLVLVNLGFCLALRSSPLPGRLLTAFVVVLVLMLYGVTSMVGEAARGSVVWRHAGIIDNLVRTGHPDPRIDAYFNWPGLFMLGASVTELAGFASPMAFARWAPVYSNLMFLAPLALILRTTSVDRRLVWLAVWLFCLGNWVNQDYFSPQSTTFFIFLVVIAVLLRWFGPEPAPTPAADRADARRRGVLMAVVVLLVAATVPTHQLTPVAILAAVTSLVAVRRCRATGLPVLTVTLLVAWLSFMTVAYMKGHAAELVENMGSLSQSASANVGERVKGSPGHLLVVRTRLAMTGALWGIAALGALRRWAQGHRDLSMVALAAAPFPLLVLQPYGGEMIMRVYLLSLPFVVFFAASLFVPRPVPVLSWGATGVIALSSCALLTGFLVSRYGNERMDQFTAAEVATVERLYRLAGPGSLLVAGAGNLPWKYRDYERHEYLVLTALWEENPVPDRVIAAAHTAMTERPGSYLIFTRSQRAYTDLLGLMPPGTLARIEHAVVGSGAFRAVHRNRDAAIYVASPQGAATS